MRHLKVAIVLVAMMSASPTFSQYNYVNTGFYTETSNFNTYMQNVDFNRTIADNVNDGSDDSDNANFVPPKADAGALVYSPSLSLRRENIARFAQSLRKNDPANATQIQAILADGKIVDQLDQLMNPMGLRTNNVADAYALWSIIAWTAVHFNEDNPVQLSDAAAAVKRQASDTLLSVPQFSSASDAFKQEIAETMLMQAVVIVDQMEVVKGDHFKRVALAKAVNQGAMQMGLDLTAMNLTEQGFVPR